MLQNLKNVPLLVKVLLLALVVVTGGYAGIEFLINRNLIPLSSTSTESASVEYENFNFYVEDKQESKPIPRVQVQIISDGPPTSDQTDNNGYLEIGIPKRKTVKIILSKDGYQRANYSVNLLTTPNTTKTFHLEPNSTASNGNSATTPESSSSTSTVTSSPAEKPIATGGTLTGKYVGKWLGNPTEKKLEDNSSNDIQVEIQLKNGSAGSKVGNIKYSRPYNPCYGDLILQSVKSGTLQLFENITSGNCISNGTTTIKLIGDDLIDYKWERSGSPVTISGSLTRQ
ncbi:MULTISPECIES: hypothetical protein [Nostoc]|uniref:PEGA domain-containing protein n=1 Tax=Nostoc paludosum FACHB-159 TaxID=2692908 RepID=A0ABR8KHI7_9NOSO|nr:MULTISPECIES: hypothetical protein [Nostoc]MBD2682675.1 hypothetical protein [Nostoc sp. FACHB-857]MBD2739009.1 hypothetical protein [Nostoc paludosum FACHB-159]